MEGRKSPTPKPRPDFSHFPRNLLSHYNPNPAHTTQTISEVVAQSSSGHSPPSNIPHSSQSSTSPSVPQNSNFPPANLPSPAPRDPRVSASSYSKSIQQTSVNSNNNNNNNNVNNSNPTTTTTQSTSNSPNTNTSKTLEITATEYDGYVFTQVPGFWEGVIFHKGDRVSVKAHPIFVADGVDMSTITWPHNFEIYDKVRSMRDINKNFQKKELAHFQLFPLHNYEDQYLRLVDACKHEFLVARVKNFEIVFTPADQNYQQYPHAQKGNYLRIKLLELPLKDLRFTLLCPPSQEQSTVTQLINQGGTYHKFASLVGDTSKINSIVIHEALLPQLRDIANFSHFLVDDHLKFYVYSEDSTQLTSCFPKGNGLIVIGPSFITTPADLMNIVKILRQFKSYFKSKMWKIYVPTQTLHELSKEHFIEIEHIMQGQPDVFIPHDPRQPKVGDAQQVAEDFQVSKKADYRYFFVAKGPPESTMHSLYCVTTAKKLLDWLEWHKKRNSAPPPPPLIQSQQQQVPLTGIEREISELKKKKEAATKRTTTESRHLVIDMTKELTQANLLQLLQKFGMVQRCFLLGGRAHVTMELVKCATNFLNKFNNKPYKGSTLKIKYENPQLGNPSRTLRIFNIGPDVKREDIEKLLGAQGVVEVPIQWIVPKHEMNRYALEVTFQNLVSAISVMEHYHDATIPGSKYHLVVTYCEFHEKNYNLNNLNNNLQDILHSNNFPKNPQYNNPNLQRNNHARYYTPNATEINNNSNNNNYNNNNNLNNSNSPTPNNNPNNYANYTQYQKNLAKERKKQHTNTDDNRKRTRNSQQDDVENEEFLIDNRRRRT